MSNIFLFKPRAELSVEKNLDNFIDLSKNKIQLWSDYKGFSWECNVWSSHRAKIRFHNLEGRLLHHTKTLPPELCLSMPFIDFAKAYMRYTQHIKQTQTFARTMAALIFLEKALCNINGCADINKASSRHFEEACNLLEQENMQDRAGIGNALKKLAEFIAEMHITVHGTKYWRHRFKGNNTQSKEAKTKSAKKKLPNDDALFALAEIFANGYIAGQDDEDIYISCHTCLLLSAPQRISESRWYRTGLLKKENDRQDNEQLYISYWVSKNAKYVNKEVPQTMAEHAEVAVNRLLKITAEGRMLAKHYETDPEKFYRHENCPDVGDDDVLSVEQVAQALGLKSIKSTSDFIRKETGSYSMTGWTLKHLWNEVVLPKHKRRNPHFPYQIAPEDCGMGKPPKMSESLMCFRFRQLSSYATTCPVLLAPFNRDYYAKRLENREIKRGNKIVNMSIFRKYGYENLVLKSHQLRHFLNTLAQEAGIGIESITIWSTRVSQTQSRTYMHQDPIRKAKRVAESLGYEVDTLEPIIEDEYALLDKGPVIVTIYGVCSHDYTLTPCQKHSDCLNCSDLLVCKGHKKTMDAIKSEYAKLTENFHVAKEKVEAGEQVANRWYLSHKATHKRLTDLINMLDDPTIEDGSVIQMAGDDFSHQQRITQDKANNNLHELVEHENISLSYNKNVSACLDLLRKDINE